MHAKLVVSAALALSAVDAAHASTAGDHNRLPDIHFIWMGGNDCPPCVAWRATELPKLQQSPAFQQVRFSYVVKSIKSSVPSRMFLPPEVAPLKEKLDEASGGRSGSPKAALLVDGEVFDFFQGTRSAAQIEAMIHAVRSGTTYPFARCLRASATSRNCEVVAR
jgi:hypothetical protein